MMKTISSSGRGSLIDLSEARSIRTTNNGKCFSNNCKSSIRAIVLTGAVALTIIGVLALVGLKGGSLASIGNSLGKTAAIIFTTIGSVITAYMLSSCLSSCRNSKQRAQDDLILPHVNVVADSDGPAALTQND